jgi:hypothetical protein
MVMMSNSRVANRSKSGDPDGDFNANKRTIVLTASRFLAGKLTDHLGAFLEITYDAQATQGPDGSFR